MTLVATQVKRRRGTTAENNAFTGAEGEITVDLTTHELRVHDGSTVGGHTIPTKNYGYSKTETDNLLSTKANVALDNLTSAGVSKLGATVYGANGLIFNCGTDPVIGTGHADVYLYKNGLAVIEFCLQITTAGVSSSEFSFGLNRDALHNANNNIPLITPVSGVCTYFDAGTGVVSGLTGYAGVLQGGLQFWRPCRVYDTLGSVGGWPASSFPIGTRIIGTVYGTYTV